MKKLPLFIHEKSITDQTAKGNVGVEHRLPFNYNTLEPKLVKSNSVETFNTLFGTKLKLDDLHRYMKNNKTECALAIFSSETKIDYPKYILDAIAK